MDPLEPLRKVDQMLKAQVEEKNRQRLEADRKYIVSQVGADLGRALQPVLDRISENSRLNRDDIYQAFRSAIQDTPIAMEAPETPVVNVNVPDVYVPEMKAPVVNYTPPAINIPKLDFPGEMDVKGWVGFMGYDRDMLNNPLPVQLRDAEGKPVNLFENLTTLINQGGSGGGGARIVKISGYDQSAFAELQNPDGRVKVELPTGSSGLTDTELRASAVPMAQVSGASWSVSVSDVFGSVGTDIINPDGRVKVELPSGASGLTDTELRASAVPVIQVSGAADSVNVVSTVGLTDTQIRANSLDVQQASGASWSTNVLTMPAVVVTSITNTTASNIVDSTGVAYSGSNPLPMTIVTSATASVNAAVISSAGVAYSGSNPFPITVVTSATATVNAAITDSGGVQYSGSNPVPVKLISGALTSSIATGPSAIGAADDGSAPVQFGGLARTANPTAVSGGQVVKASFDDLGRQITRNIQVRDLISTAYVSVSNGTETTLLAGGGAGVFLDCIALTATNNSSAAVQVDIRSSTAGSIVHTMYLPASSGPIGWVLPVPYPQDNANNNWTVDLPDITGTTVYFTALFSKEV